MSDTDIRPEILRLRAVGYSWDRIGAHFGKSYSTVRAMVDPDFALRRKARKDIRTGRRRGDRCKDATYSHLFTQTSNRVDPEVVKARLAEIPPDTRDNTGRLLGDPLPARSALAQRNQA